MTFGIEKKLASGRTRGLQYHGQIILLGDTFSRLKGQSPGDTEEDDSCNCNLIQAHRTGQWVERKVLGKNSDFVQKQANREDGRLIS